MVACSIYHPSHQHMTGNKACSRRAVAEPWETGRLGGTADIPSVSPVVLGERKEECEVHMDPVRGGHSSNIDVLMICRASTTFSRN